MGTNNNNDNILDLYIIDQHASDERAKLEKLQNTAVASQQLLHPRPLNNLSFDEEQVR